MGHYRADLACDKCQEVRCRCEVVPVDETKILLEMGGTLAQWRQKEISEIHKRYHLKKGPGWLCHMHMTTEIQMLNVKAMFLERKKDG